MLNRFRSSGRGRSASVVVWALLGLLIVGLTGLGLGGMVSSLGSQNVATVGDVPVSRERFVRQIFRQLDGLAAQTGQRFTMEQARAFGLDTQILGQLMAQAAMDGEAETLGLSVTDEMVRDALVESPGFEGLSGGFDPQAYRQFLDRQNLSAREYEEEMRHDLTRGLIEVGIAAGVEMPPVLAETMLAWRGERRSFEAVRIGADQLSESLPEPDETALQAQYEADPDAYSTPETRVVTYAALTPESMAAQIEITEEDLRTAYGARAERYRRPERRIVDMIAFPDEAAAGAARDAIDAGQSDFDALVAARGLTAQDVDLGSLEREDLRPGAREAVFGAEGPGVVGPVDTDVGPALYRINAVVPERTTPFEEAEADLRAELAQARARERIGAYYDPVQDLLAAGATLEEVAAETALDLGEVGLTDEPGEGLAGDAAFRTEAFEAEPGEPRDMFELEGGGLAVLRVERVEPPALRPLDEVREQVAADWRAAETLTRLRARAAELEAQLKEGRTVDFVAGEAGLEVQSLGPVTRGADPGGDLPTGTVGTVFDLAPRGTALVEAEDGSALWLVQLAEVLPADRDAEAWTQALEAERAQQGNALSRGLFEGFARMVMNDEGVSVNRQLIETELARYP